MLRQRLISIGELQEIYDALGEARIDILSRKVPESGEATRRAMLQVIETMYGWMRIGQEVQLGLVKCWTALEGLEVEMGEARRYLEKSEIASWPRVPMSMNELPELVRRHERSKDTREALRVLLDRTRAIAEEENRGPFEESIQRAMQVVGWTLEEWLVRSETAEAVLTRCREAYEELEQDFVTVRENAAAAGKRRHGTAGADARKTAPRSKKDG